MQIVDFRLVLLILLSAVIIAGSLLAASARIVRAIRGNSEDAVSARAVTLMATFGSALGEARNDPRAILTWEPLARAARKAWPREFGLLDQASGGSFPFSKEFLQAAHAQWTTDWLAWELTHDTQSKLKTALAEQELVASGNAPHMRAKLDAIEREKLDQYQRRYAEYIRVAKALQTLL